MFARCLACGAHTRAFARIIGPWLVLVPSIIALRAGDMGTLLAAFFANPAIVWMTGSLLLFAGLLIIAFHQVWSSPAAIAISLFGWFLALRGFVLMAVPEWIEHGATASLGMLPLVRIGFGVLVVIGLWLTFVGWTSDAVVKRDPKAP